MGEVAAIQRMSAEEYLAWERDQPEKHGYEGAFELETG